MAFWLTFSDFFSSFLWLRIVFTIWAAGIGGAAAQIVIFGWISLQSMNFYWRIDWPLVPCNKAVFLKPLQDRQFGSFVCLLYGRVNTSLEIDWDLLFLVLNYLTMCEIWPQLVGRNPSSCHLCGIQKGYIVIILKQKFFSTISILHKEMRGIPRVTGRIYKDTKKSCLLTVSTEKLHTIQNRG